MVPTEPQGGRAVHVAISYEAHHRTEVSFAGRGQAIPQIASEAR